MSTGMLIFKAPRKLIYMLDMSMPEDITLRVVTFLANIASVAKNLNIDPIYDLPSDIKAAAPDTMWVLKRCSI